MNDFLIGMGIAGGGGFAMIQIDSAQALSSQQSSCTRQGGIWNPAATATEGEGCYLSGKPVEVSTTYNQWGVVIDLGVPLAAAFLLTRSIPGAFGAATGVGLLFLIGASQIH